MKKRMALVLVMIVSLSMLFANGASEQASTYPSKDITCIVIAAAGGGTDAMARAVTVPLEKQLGKPVVVINNGSAGGLVATGDIADAEPDGYTIGVFSNTDVANFAYGDDNGISVDDYTYIAALNNTGDVLIMKQNSQFKDLQSFIDYAKANPERITIGLPSPIQEMSHSLLDEALGVKTTSVVYSGGNKVFADLLGGHIDAGILSAKFISQAADQNMLVMGLLLSNRLSSFPDVPTFTEQGYPVDNPARRMLVGPKNMPKTVVDCLVSELKKGFEGEMSANIKAIGEVPALMTGAELDAFLKSDFAMREAFLNK
jgi:Uncharacterized protein conserved in bacteria